MLLLKYELFRKKKYMANRASSKEQQCKPFQSKSGFLHLSTLDILDQVLLCFGGWEGAILCSTRCLAASPASTH